MPGVGCGQLGMGADKGVDNNVGMSKGVGKGVGKGVDKGMSPGSTPSAMHRIGGAWRGRFFIRHPKDERC